MTSRAARRDDRVFVDTSAWVALLRRADDKHPAARGVLSRLIRSQSRLYITNFVIAEIHAFLVSRADVPLATRFLTETSHTTFNIVRVSSDDEERAKEIIVQYSDKDFTFTDATSFSVMERLDIHIAFTFDKHFEQFGFIVLTS